mmetsp:Transcript_75530/g.244372  ORF Transcript_75530/g.244372 Transcript_75530/m.244372 type:complete len:249 (+) Transcript_75530:1047-1793(+)
MRRRCAHTWRTASCSNGAQPAWHTSCRATSSQASRARAWVLLVACTKWWRNISLPWALMVALLPQTARPTSRGRCRSSAGSVPRRPRGTAAHSARKPRRRQRNPRRTSPSKRPAVRRACRACLRLLLRIPRSSTRCRGPAAAARSWPGCPPARQPGGSRAHLLARNSLLTSASLTRWSPPARTTRRSAGCFPVAPAAAHPGASRSYGSGRVAPGASAAAAGPSAATASSPSSARWPRTSRPRARTPAE